MARVFISYRREDSAASAGRLFDRLREPFGEENVFRDLDTISAGEEFARIITETIAQCDVLIAVIGSEWLTMADAEGKRRLEDPHDFVKAEIHEALRLRKRVIPVLVNGATMPKARELPKAIAALAGRNAIEISEARFNYDAERLIHAIDPSEAVLCRWLKWFSDERRQRTLTFIGTGLVAVIAGLWQAYLHVSEKRKDTSTPSVSAFTGGIAAGKDVSARAAPGGTAVIATGNITIITINSARRADELIRRRQEVLAGLSQASAADKEKIALLEKQLVDINAKLENPETALEGYKDILEKACQAIDDLKGEFSPEQREQACQGLTEGDANHAEKLFQQVLLLSEDKEHAAEASYQLGQLAYSRIDYTGADRYLRKAMDLQPDNPFYLNAAGLIADTKGHYADAEPLYRRALAIREKTLGSQHPDVASSLNNLAGVYNAREQYGKAESLWQQALAIREKAFGPDHPDVAASLGSLALLYVEQRQYAKAEPLLQRALAIVEKAFGPDHLKVAPVLDSLAVLYGSQGQYGKAEPLLQRALAIEEKAFGPDHPRVATNLEGLVLLYVEQRQYAKAELLCRRALAIREKAFGPDDPGVASDLSRLAMLYVEQGQYGKAEPLYQRALAIFKKTFGPDHPNVADSLNSLASLYKKQGQYAKAEPLYRLAQAIFEKTLGPSDLRLASSLISLAMLYNKQGQYAKAEPLYRRALAIFEKILGPNHPFVAVTLNDLAGLYRAQGQAAKAEAMEARAKAISAH